MKSILTIFSTCLAVSIDKPKLVFPGTQCPVVSGSEKWDLQAYMGSWHSAAVSPIIYVPTSASCVGSNYSWNEEKQFINVLNYYTNKNGNYVPVPGTATVTRQGVLCDEVFAVNYGCDNYIVLDTDNTEYSFAWQCVNEENSSSPVLYILTRELEVSETTLEKYYEKVRQIIKDADPTYPIDRVLSQMRVYDNINC